jgi:glycosyltransferase involved in cell wall biosynthesis
MDRLLGTTILPNILASRAKIPQKTGIEAMKFLFLSSHAHYALDTASTRVSGGAELQVALLARELAALGHEVVIVGGDTGQQDKHVVQGVITRTGGKFHTGTLGDTLLALPRIMLLLWEYRPRYVVVLGWTAWLFILAQLRLFWGMKVIFICGLDTEIDGSFAKRHGWRGWLFERGVEQSDGRFAMSEVQREFFQKLGLQAGFYRNLLLPRSEPLSACKEVDLLWVGRCQTIKRPHRFLDLVQRLPQARCEMICPKEDERLWKEIAARAETLPNLSFHERIPYHAIQEHYDRARFLVSTSETEGFPNVMIHAAQGGAGILSLSLDPDGLIKQFDLGYCAADDFERLVATTAEFLADPRSSERMSRHAEKMLAIWFDNTKNTENFLKGLP